MDEFDGYLADVPYPATHHIELEPEQLAFAALVEGVPSPMTRPLRYLELGCGRGISANLIAAAGNHEVWCVDLHQAHASEAAQLARDSGANVRVFGESFAEFVERKDIPEFDVVALHGVWSWISPEQQRTILALLRRHVAIGGLVYVSYNAMPGWATNSALPGFLRAHHEATGRGGSLDEQLVAGLGLLRKVAELGGGHFRANPPLSPYLDVVAASEPAYRTHEWLSRHWRPLYFSEVAADLRGAHLDYIGQAHLREHLAMIHAPEPLQRLVAEIADPFLREVVRDLVVNRNFRRDVYVRGRTRLLGNTRKALWAQARFVLATPPKRITLELSVPGGPYKLDPDIADVLLGFLAEGAKEPQPLGELLSKESARAESILKSVTALVGTGQVRPVQHEALQKRSRKAIGRLNASLVNRALSRGDVPWLASPLTGGGVPVSRLHQVYLGVRATAPKGASIEDALRKYIADTGLQVAPDDSGKDDPSGVVDASIAEFLECLPTYEALGLQLTRADEPERPPATLPWAAATRPAGLPTSVPGTARETPVGPPLRPPVGSPLSSLGGPPSPGAPPPLAGPPPAGPPGMKSKDG